MRRLLAIAAIPHGIYYVNMRQFRADTEAAHFFWLRPGPPVPHPGYASGWSLYFFSVAVKMVAAAMHFEHGNSVGLIGRIFGSLFRC